MINCLPDRASGVLLHVTSLPGPSGIGELGQAAHDFVHWLQQAGQRYWQVLPLGPTGYGESPYQLLSAYAGNPLLISLQSLGYASPQSAADPSRVHFESVTTSKKRALSHAGAEFLASANETDRERVERFIEETPWLDDYALFATLKERFDLLPWHLWPREYADRDPAALNEASWEHATALFQCKLEQFWFHEQWAALRRAAQEADIRIIGDIPIYVAHDSCEVWCARELFDLAPDGSPHTIAGVPPDYFSATGQRWGNPLYRWERHAEDGFAWWRSRLAHAASMFDLIRVDHFRGFDSYWAIPSSCETAVDGVWLAGPGLSFFNAIRAALGDLPLIAEDLGLLTDSVHVLRATLGLPGMRVLQFGFDGEPTNPHAPHNIETNVVCYTGTHDNDTTRGWYDGLDDLVRERVGSRDGAAGAADVLIDMALQSPAQLVIIPMQDILGLDSRARFNTPGVIGGNWLWRVTAADLTTERAARLARKTGIFQRNH